MPGLDPGIHAERKIDAERKLIQGTPHQEFVSFFGSGIPFEGLRADFRCAQNDKTGLALEVFWPANVIRTSVPEKFTSSQNDKVACAEVP